MSCKLFTAVDKQMSARLFIGCRQYGDIMPNPEESRTETLVFASTFVKHRFLFHRKRVLKTKGNYYGMGRRRQYF